MNTLDLTLCDELLRLDVERALYWPAQQTLLVADVRLGNGTSLHRAGIALPNDNGNDDLERLQGLIQRYKPRQLVVLGQLVHSGAGQHSTWVKRVRDWRASHPRIAMRLLEGDQPRHYDVNRLGFEVLSGAFALGPFLLCHQPRHDGQTYVLAGRACPGVILREGWHHHRLPAFRFGKQIGLLPAFGSFASLQIKPMQADEQVVAIVPHGLLHVPRSTSASAKGQP
jgi:DNA ligase-associated metallophosphoesterase